MVIGMTFATLEGKLIRTGGMVVKNVAGLDMGKLMIGSFGTLAAIATLNFRVYPMPAGTRTFVQEFDADRGRNGGARRGAEEQAAAGRDRYREIGRQVIDSRSRPAAAPRFWIATRAS